MSNVFKKQPFQHLFKVVVVFIVAVIVIEYNYSILSTSLNLKNNNKNMFVTDIPVNEFNKTLSSPDGYNVPPPGYLVWNDHCRMPDVYPFTPDVMQIFKKKNYSSCSNELPLTKVLFDINSRAHSLHIDEVAKRKFAGSGDNVFCCYQSVSRAGKGQRVDKDYKLSECTLFDDGYVLPADVEGLIVTCMSMNGNKTVHKDAHYVVREKPEVRERLKTFAMRNDTKRAVSVLLMGIDSMSRFNLRRTMPETAAKFLNNGWFEMSGYNKVAENTLPNLMALLSGYNLTTAYSRCKLPEPGGLDNCNIIWDLFRKNGYATGYLEDETWMSTFDYVVKGFINVPVDYYPRPFMMAIEDNLEVKKKSGMKFCVGLRHSAEYVYDFALELATRFQNEPYFGLFWTNTFTHNSFDDASIMDTRIAAYLDDMEERGILDTSIVIFFSDHGTRFGPLRRLKQGFLDERLPFVFIWLPPWFQAKHPDFVEALRVNRYRLTNPYDIHMTMKHIIELSGRTSKLPQAVDCPNCQSLFFPVPEHRSCKDIAIDDHWCTCVPYENFDTGDTKIVDAVEAVLAHLNTYLKNGKFFPRCMPLKLKNIEEAQIKVDLDGEHIENTDIYRIRFIVKTTDEAKFEASVAYSNTLKTYTIIDNVSRLDSYEKNSRCINDKSAKMYCICDKDYMKRLMAALVPGVP